MGSVSRFIKKMPNPLERLAYATIPFAYRYGKVYRETLKKISRSQWWSYEQLQVYQLRQLQALLEHAYRNVPYYTRVFDERRIKPEDIRCIDDLQALPILTKAIIHTNKNDLMARNISGEGAVSFSTSGSTGEPLSFFGDVSMYKKEAAFITRAYNSHGAKLYTQKSIWLRRYVPEGNAPIYRHDYDLNRLYLSAYHLSQKRIEEYLELMNRYGARVLVGYPSSIYIFALMLQKSGLRPKYIDTIHVASEKLLKEWKDIIEKTIGVPVKTHYGMMEKVSMFFQCDHTDIYHESMEYGVTEYVAIGTGQSVVVGTGFMNYRMPFIRYKMNDTAILNDGDRQCSCGRGLPLTVVDFEGRTDDILYGTNGRVVPGVNFYTMMYSIPGIEMFQIIQNDQSNITVNIVPTMLFNDASRAKVESGTKARLGRVNIALNIVDQISRSKESGKIRCIINRCDNSDFQ